MRRLPNNFLLQVNRHKHGRGQRADDVDSYLALFEHKRQANGRLLAPEVAAISAFLVMTVKEFSLFQHADTVIKVCAAGGSRLLLALWSTPKFRQHIGLTI